MKAKTLIAIALAILMSMTGFAIYQIAAEKDENREINTDSDVTRTAVEADDADAEAATSAVKAAENDSEATASATEAGKADSEAARSAVAAVKTDSEATTGAVEAYEPAPTEDKTSAPVLVLTVIPPYGDAGGLFEGVVFTENGGAFDPSDYVVICYLKIADSGSWWIKPYAASYKNAIESNGFFRIRTNTGGSDNNAVAFEFYIISNDYFENGGSAAHDDVAAAAFDRVAVTRTAEGDITQTPERTVPENRFRLPEISAAHIMVDVDFFTYGAPGTTALTERMIDEYYDTISPFVNAVRIYDSFSDEYDYAYKRARELGFYVVGSAWLDKSNASEHFARLDKLIERANNGEIDMAVVASEALLRNDFSTDKMIEYLKYVRERITDPTIPVTFADSINFVYEDSRLASYCDVLLVNDFPLWNGESIDVASDSFFSAVDSVMNKYPRKTVIVSETGWASAGSAVGDAEMSPENAARYFGEIREKSLERGLRVFYLMLADCDYKGTAANHDNIESHFGIFTKDLVIKPEFVKLSPFADVEIPHVRHTLTHVEAKEATKDADGCTEYWKCGLCGKYFSDSDGKREIPANSVAVKYSSVPGDADRNGTINARDVIAVMRYIAGWKDDGFDPALADITGDGRINAKDVLFIMKVLINNR